MYLFADLDREMETENEKQPTSQLWFWLVKRIKKQLPLLYKELCLEFYNPWENQYRVNRDYYILVHSAIEFFIRKE